MKKLIKIIKQINGGILLTALVFGFFYLLGLIVEVVECHPWLFIPLGAYAIYIIFKMVSE